MDSGISTIRNLLYIVLVLALLAAASSLYLGTQLARHTIELQRLSKLMQDQLMTNATAQSLEIQKKLDQLDADAAGMDRKMQAQQDQFVARMNAELPKTLDRYVKSRAPMFEQQALKQIPRQ